MRRRIDWRWLIGGGLIGAVALAAVVSTLWTPFDPNIIDLKARLAAPSARHWLGTDEFGRDQVSRLMAGARVSLTLALVVVGLATVLGTLLGAIAGYGGGLFDRLLMMVNDAILSFPGVLLALGIMVIVGPGATGIIVALSIHYTPTVIRLVRGMALSLGTRDFIEASRLMGNSEIATLRRHILPNLLGPVAALAASMIGWTLLSESALSFLGLGIAAPQPSWGNMLAAARPHIETAPWLGLAPGACLTLTLLGFNVLGEALRDHLDPRRP